VNFVQLNESKDPYSAAIVAGRPLISTQQPVSALASMSVTASNWRAHLHRLTLLRNIVARQQFQPLLVASGDGGSFSILRKGEHDAILPHLLEYLVSCLQSPNKQVREVCFFFVCILWYCVSVFFCLRWFYQ
jgi:hypothetical protein